jgi:hypothetical protein
MSVGCMQPYRKIHHLAELQWYKQLCRLTTLTYATRTLTHERFARWRQHQTTPRWTLVDTRKHVKKHPQKMDWIVTDDRDNGLRVIAIKGSDSLSHWRQNLQFDPVPFLADDLGILVHRGCYGSATRLYETLLPYLQDAPAGTRFCFTGHSIGGSIAMLLMLMAVFRGDMDPITDLRGTVTYGAPTVLCTCAATGASPFSVLGGLDRIEHVIMPYDIVPKVFSCNYSPFVPLLRRLNPKVYEAHPCPATPATTACTAAASCTIPRPSEAVRNDWTHADPTARRALACVCHRDSPCHA